MFDSQPLGTHIKEPKILVGRFIGAGAAAPTVPTSTTPVPDSGSTQCKVTYNSTGNVTYKFLDVPLGVLQNYDFWVVGTNTGATQKFCAFAPPAAGVYSFTVTTCYQNGTAVDLTTSEEIHYMIVSGQTKP